MSSVKWEMGSDGEETGHNTPSGAKKKNKKNQHFRIRVYTQSSDPTEPKGFKFVQAKFFIYSFSFTFIIIYHQRIIWVFFFKPEHKPFFIAGTPRHDLNIQEQSWAPGQTHLVHLHCLNPHRPPLCLTLIGWQSPGCGCTIAWESCGLRC